MGSVAQFPLVSVVIAARDMERFIGDTLESLVRQTESAFEVVVVDDRSRDGTKGIVRTLAARDSRFRVITGPGGGVSRARNAGLAASHGALVLFLDADDLLTPDAIARLHSALSASDAPAAMGGVVQVDEAGARLPGADNRALAPRSDHLPALLRKNFVVNGGALLIRRAAIESAGAYDPGLSHGEDWEFWCRLAEQGDFVVVSGPPLLFYRQRAGGANYRALGRVFARDMACVRKLAERPSLHARLGRRLPRLLRDRRIDIFWSAVRNEYRFGTRRRAALAALAGLVIFPDSVARPRLALRFLKSLGR